MARIRKTDERNVHAQQMIWKVGKYIRLSREDGHEVSESVVNQDKILNDEIPSFFQDGLYCGKKPLQSFPQQRQPGPFS